MTIWKFVLRLADFEGIEMPIGARIVHVAAQFENVCMWAVLDETNPPEERRFTVVGTGHIVPADGEYVGTALMHGGTFVWHVFEVPA